MTDSAKQNCTFRPMNPWVFHFQKLGLELKCPLCLQLLKQPSLLPCDHIFCKSCLPETTKIRSECPLCKAHYAQQDLRHVPFIENIVTIYKGLDAAFSANPFQSGPSDSSFGNCGKESMEIALRDNLSSDTPRGKQLALTPLNCSAENGIQKTDTEGKSKFQLDMGLDRNGGDRNSENDSCEQSPQKYQAQRPDKRKIGDSCTSETDVSSRDLKRHKKLDHTPLKKCTTSSQTGNLGVSNSQSNHKSAKNCNAQTPDSSTSKTVCGFCQSFKISMETGPMLHFVNEKLVAEGEANVPGAIHVHKICIDWAPRVYFDDQTAVKNLKSEVSRGSRLKCSGCGRKGAALGCYHEPCKRSYHVMCAKEVAGFRWDYEDFLVLCPYHTNVKFPNEKKSKSKLKNRLGNSQMPSQHSHVPDKMAPQNSNFWTESTTGAKEWVFCGSALSSEDKCLLVELGTMIGVPVTKFWRPDVTHVIAATDEKGACTRTLKVLMAILHGKWVLTIDWVKACMNSIQPVAEEAYEVSLDNHGSQNGPRTGRLSVLNNEPRLFSGFDFYFSGDFVPGRKEDLKNLVKAAGGNVIESKEEIVQKTYSQLAGSSRALVVYDVEPPQGCKLGEEATVLWQRLNEAEELAAKIGSQAVGHTWLLESTAAYKLQPLVGLH